VAIALGLGATKILGIGRNPDRLSDVSSLGSDERVVVASSEEEKDLPAWIKKHTKGLGPDIMYDCLGVGGDATSTMDLIRSVKRGGCAILVAGGAEGDLSQSYTEAMMHDVSIVGSVWFTTGEVDDLIELVSAGVIDLSYLEHKSFSLDNANEAIQFVGDRPGGKVNVVVKPGMK
jgi:threonine dehydrogenase-like Zn-dependent dehydrogenase